MKISFSTLGCPGWPWREIITTAKDCGYDGVEIRGLGNKIYAPGAEPFLPENISATKERLKKLNIEIPILTTGICLNNSGREEVAREAEGYLRLAKDLGVPYIRVMVTPRPEPIDIDTEAALKTAKMLCEMAKPYGVTVLIETNGVFSDSSALSSFLKKVGADNSGALWDIHHPFRYKGESPQETYNNLKEYIKHVHVKDSVMENGKVRYKMTGRGDVPVKEAVELLKNGGYEGYVSLEWTKRWEPDLEEPGIVFANFMEYIKLLK